MLTGAGIPHTVKSMDMRDVPEGGLEHQHPSIESSPAFLCRIPDSSLVPACRNFNGSICDWNGWKLMAYRSEAHSAMNRVCMAILDCDYKVLTNCYVEIEPEPGVHYEDPRLSVVAGELYLIVAHVKFGIPNVCRQRLFRLDEEFRPVDEIEMPYGNSENGLVEKNWLPFELPGGKMGLVYSQRPHLVIEVESSVGHHTPGAKGFGWGKSMNGRTPPIRIDDDHYLSFFGGHTKHDFRGARYYMGAQLFSATAPHGVTMATKNPLAWGSELSQTILSARPASGHPCCIFPAGVIREGESLIVSCGVNDSYTVLLKYSIQGLIDLMTPVTAKGEFYDAP